MRVFFALDFDQQSHLVKIAEFQQDLLASGGDVKLIPRENIHFTLLFIGEIESSLIEDVKTKMEGIVFTPVNLRLHRTGYFPGGGRINVIWIGVDNKAEEQMSKIHNDIIARLDGTVPFDRKPFRAHLTIARVKSGRNKEQLVKLITEHADEEFGQETLDTLKLKQSSLTPSGPVYTDILEFHSKNGA
jgi:2'-5' RNA ligase